MNSDGTRLFIYGVSLVVSVYIFGCLLNRKFKKIHLSRALMYISSLAMIGALSEIFFDTIYVHIFHERLWYYQFLPVHHAYTSEYSPVIWGSMGLFLYLVHQKYEKCTRKELFILSAFFSLETAAMEGLAVFVSKFFLGKYVFYYNPGNLWHVTSLQSIPFYFVVGILTIQTIHWFKAQPQFFTVFSTYVTTVAVFFK